MEIDIVDNSKYLSKSLRTKMLSTMRFIIDYLDLPDNTELCISIVDDVEMRKLNRTYRSIDRTTDILSFSQDVKPHNNILGDIVISHETAQRHADKYGISIEQELKKLLVHGILHLLGHDHKKKKEKEIMRCNEEKILNALND